MQRDYQHNSSKQPGAKQRPSLPNINQRPQVKIIKLISSIAEQCKPHSYVFNGIKFNVHNIISPTLISSQVTKHSDTLTCKSILVIVTSMCLSSSQHFHRYVFSLVEKTKNIQPELGVSTITLEGPSCFTQLNDIFHARIPLCNIGDPTQ